MRCCFHLFSHVHTVFHDETSHCFSWCFPMLFYPILSPEFPPGPASLQGPPSVNRLTSAKSAFISASERNKIQVRWVRWVRATGKLSLVMYRHVADLGWYMGDIWVISCLPWNGIVVDLCPRWSLVGTVGTPKVQELSSKVCHEKSKKSDNALTPRRSAPVVCCARPGLLQSIAAQTSQVPFLDFWNGGDIPR